MKFYDIFFTALFAGAVVARSGQHVGKKLPEKPRLHSRAYSAPRPQLEKRQSSQYLTNATEKYAVNGSALPYVDFDIGESYAGLMPISNATNSSELYFWFFPSTNPNATKEITIWLNGGPGCSSLEGFFQENGPVLWQYGTYRPVYNPWTWVNLTNMVWVEQPVGTGFSQGKPTATSDSDVAEQFLGFFKNFVDTFAMQGYTVYITGESYAGYYVPYISSAMLDKNDKEYYNFSSMMIYDPSLSYDVVQEQIPATPFATHWQSALGLNDSFINYLQRTADSCGYTSFIEQALVYPPTGPLPTPPNIKNNNKTCDLFDAVMNAATLSNPCFDVYQIYTTCPLLWDVLGFPGSFDYVPDGAFVYFNLTSVQEAINAPIQEWAECTSKDVFVNGTDHAIPSALSVLPGVIERADRVIIGHGLLDMVLIWNGTLIATQNMTWNGAQGISVAPSNWTDFYVPYHNSSATVRKNALAGAGVMGQYHTERGLTLVTIDLSGHMVPQYAPSAAYRQMEFLLGRIPDLGTVSPFTTLPDNSY